MSIASLINATGIGISQHLKKKMNENDGEKSKSKTTLTAQAVGTTLGISGFIGRMSQGALYSMGAEPIVAQHGFGFSVVGRDLASDVSDNKFGKPGQIFGPKSLMVPGSGVGRGFKPPTSLSSNMLNTSAAGLGGKFGQNIMKQTLASSLLPIGMTAYFSADAYASGGMEGLGKYLIADILGNYYGAEAGLYTAGITSTDKAAGTISKLSGMSKAEILAGEGFVQGNIVQRINPILRSGLLGRMLPTAGGILGGTIGMEIGANAGSMIGNMTGYDLEDNMSRIGGGFFGAVAGAKFGSYALSSVPRAIATGIGAMAVTSVASNTMSAIQAGFENTMKNRGLNYAGETAAYFTQNAVTMRERAMQQIHKSHMNARSALGQEASLMHMNRDMFSQYKRA